MPHICEKVVEKEKIILMISAAISFPISIPIFCLLECPTKTKLPPPKVHVSRKWPRLNYQQCNP